MVRVRGSHHVLANGALRTTVPVHGNRVLRIGTLRGILRDVDIAPMAFAALWND
ncbi:MAG: type II toxin-antitoxin system HicA family toxin [Acidobacteriota bacterium]|nr:type II toxin-antitoxin system HicA family toxin [Acidobacteriota bacterium]